ncbi:kelch-like protein [Paenibacillus sp. Marseille-Q4541]|uniref:Kelch repeat-containing protein n=1 Tax=Paenibacillus sp. Marseille-Q4541 TaxID=2831522 RepID=UPI001BA66238|nr:kelch-like protein [Paenibacillus sp. Marseille-Q4541]
MKKFILSAVFTLFFTHLLGSLSASAAENSWEQKANMPGMVYTTSSVVYNDEIYVVNGSSNCCTLNTLYKFNPITNSWTTLAPSNVARERNGAAVVNGKIYSMSKGSLEEYDPATNKWTKKANMLNEKQFFSTSVLNGKIYVIGGNTNASPTAKNTVQIYDPKTDSWTEGPSLNVARYKHSSVVYNGKIYVFGGQRYVTDIEVFDPETNTWTMDGSMPKERLDSATVILGSKVYFLGGYELDANGYNVKTKNFPSYDIETKKWEYQSDLTVYREAPAAAVVNGKIYIMGGRSEAGILNSVEEYTLNSVPPTEPGNPGESFSNRAILTITLTNGSIKEYDLPADDINNFISWYDNYDSGIGTSKFGINKYNNNLGPFKKRVDYITFNSIVMFEVNEY